MNVCIIKITIFSMLLYKRNGSICIGVVEDLVYYIEHETESDSYSIILEEEIWWLSCKTIQS